MWELVEEETEESKKAQREVDEVDIYINGIALSRPTDNPLFFWKMQEDPYLASLARKYLAMPATSASVERLFSVAGSVIRCRRARINISTAEQILCYQQYLCNGPN